MNTEEKMKKILILKKAILKNIVDTAYYAGASSAHIGGALSAVDIVSTLFSEFIKINPENIKKIDRDYFILSKGHACLVYYAALVEMGFFSRDELKSFEKTDSFLLGHPVLDKKHGIDFSTGSLGMGLSIGVGLALSLKKRKVNNKMGKHIANTIQELILKKNLNLIKCKALILGITFKENCSDIRNSRIFNLYKELKKLEIKVDIYDPHAIQKEVLKNFKIKLLDNINSKYDIIILAVAHKKFLKMNLVNFKTPNGIIYDVKSVLDENIISGRL